MGELIYNIEELDVRQDSLIEKIDKAVLAAAFKIRDNARTAFRNSKSLYKKTTDRFFELEKGINVGKLKDHETTVHSFGKKEIYNSFKTRFFVGGTRIRFSNKGSSKGYIVASNVIEEAADQNVLNNYVKNTING